MKYTNVFATPEEIEEIKGLLAKLGTQGADAIYEKLQKRIHVLALKHGLPDIKGFYGMKTSSGEFLTYYDAE